MEQRIKIPWKPFPKQKVFHDDGHKFRALITGVGFGKTAAGANEFLKMAVTHPNSLHAIIAPNGKILNNATLPEFFKYARPLIKYERKSKNMIYLVGGAQVVYLTADNLRHVDRIRGLTLGSFWADEGSLFLDDFWKILVGRLRSRGGPLRGIVTATPKGMNWMYWRFVKKAHRKNKQTNPNASEYAWFGGSTLDNPYTPQEYKDTLLSEYTGMFLKQEIYGEFVGFEGQVYSQFRQDLHVIKEDPAPEKIREWTYGVDWGWRHPMVCLLIAYDNDGNAYVLHEFYESNVTVDTLIEWFKTKREEIGKTHNISTGYGDPAEPQFIQAFNNAGIPMQAADHAIIPGINEVSKMLEPDKTTGKPRLYVHERCANTIDEFGRYRFKDVIEGQASQENPLKIHDDAMDAMRYVIKTHQFDREPLKLLDSQGWL
jgi:PBSX family phage terminase large subunit